MKNNEHATSERILREKKKIYCVGTVRKNQLAGLALLDDKAMKAKGKGTYQQKTATHDGVNLWAIKWFDKRPIQVASCLCMESKVLNKRKGRPPPAVVLEHKKNHRYSFVPPDPDITGPCKEACEPQQYSDIAVKHWFVCTCLVVEVRGTESPLAKRPALDAWFWQESAMKQHQNERKTKMKTNQLEDPQAQNRPQSACQQELNKVLEEISKMTSEDNRGPLENLYGLKFPNCDKHGLYNPKQCNMSTHGQRGECWCVDPLTGVQIPATPKVRGDPNCNQFQEKLRAMPTEATPHLH
ncbi:insulin-like growth factor-binding protein 2 [Micropterus dolomieu]|uniref:insulin-like growth factor-binding protein 2 n=1 Tax=Micropterus dolomieu TaxID=147949 RepID=UPI001E8E30D1|nr:insulin-like growth factor-binding protein 2 [Micropterus dolomieu]